MTSIKNTVMAGLLIASTLAVTPALAQHHRYDGHNHGNNIPGVTTTVRHDSHWSNNNDRDYYYDRNHRRHWRKRVANRYNNNNNNNDWNSQRTLYRNNWGRMSSARQQELNAQMRAQWLAYNHNNYNGNYSWNTYNNPQFMDYLHTNNPGLLTTIRNYVGF